MLVYSVLFPWGGGDPARPSQDTAEYCHVASPKPCDYVVIKLWILQTAVFPLSVMRDGLGQGWVEVEETSRSLDLRCKTAFFSSQ